MTDLRASAQLIDVGNAAPALPAPAPPDFRTVYEAEFGYVWNTLRRVGVAERDLEDLCHDVFVAFYRSGYDPSRPLRPWLFGIAFRVASDHRRRAQIRLEVPVASAEPTATAPSADEEVESGRRRQLVRRALGALDDDKRAVFVLHEIDGLPMPQIATALGIPLNTAYSRLRLAREVFGAAVRAAEGRR